MSLLHLLRLFEEVLGDNGEELGGIGRPVLVEQGREIGSGSFGQRPIFATEDASPRCVHRSPRQNWGAVRGAVLLVKLMGELMQRNIPVAGKIGGAMQNMIPRDDHHAGP